MRDLNKYIDQTMLKPSATEKEIITFLQEVVEYEFCAGVVNPCWVSLARNILPPHIKVCSVVGFPLGASSTRTKVYATEDLIMSGCDEIDMVLNIGKLISKDYKYVGDEINAVVEKAENRTVKVIIETCLLSDDLKRTAAVIIEDNGGHFVKTSTGFSKAGAKVEDIRLLKQTIGDKIRIKASGGIRDHIFTVELIENGADRIGTSAGVDILNSYRSSE